MNKTFSCGAAAALGFMMAIQDWYGLDGYIQHVRDHWIELPWWVGASICVVATIAGNKAQP